MSQPTDCWRSCCSSPSSWGAAGGGQTLLIVSAVAVGVIIVIFITSLIFGLQDQLTELLTDAIPHVTVTVEEPETKPLDKVPGVPEGPSSSRIEQQAPHRHLLISERSHRIYLHRPPRRNGAGQ